MKKLEQMQALIDEARADIKEKIALIGEGPISQLLFSMALAELSSYEDELNLLRELVDMAKSLGVTEEELEAITNQDTSSAVMEGIAKAVVGKQEPEEESHGTLVLTILHSGLGLSGDYLNKQEESPHEDDVRDDEDSYEVGGEG